MGNSGSIILPREGKINLIDLFYVILSLESSIPKVSDEELEIYFNKIFKVCASLPLFLGGNASLQQFLIRYAKKIIINKHFNLNQVILIVLNHLNKQQSPNRNSNSISEMELENENIESIIK